MKSLLVLAILLLAGCAISKAPTSSAIYDFGAQRLGASADIQERSEVSISGGPRLRASLLVPDIAAPVWLDNPAIQYRLAYHDPARVYAYGANRWAAAPASLLAQRIRNRIAAVNEGGVVSLIEGARTNYTLLLELEEFTQVFDTAERSRAVVKFRATLIDRRSRALVGQRSFRAEGPAREANAAGAVHALTDASDKAIGSLIAWLADELPETKKTSVTEG